MAEQPDYPWYAVVGGPVLEQGDILRDCPRYVLSAEALSQDRVKYDQVTTDAVVLSQSCDLVPRTDGQYEVTDVLLCSVYRKKDLENHPAFRKEEVWEEIRKGRRHFHHVLNECLIDGHEQDFLLVDFHALFTLSIPVAVEFASKAGDHLRLLPPYREHLSQSFARLFMRVGLPADIAPFGKRK